MPINVPSLQGLRLAQASSLPGSKDGKLDRILQKIANGLSPDQLKKNGKSLLRMRGDKVLVSAQAEGDANTVANALRALGADVTGTFQASVSAFIPTSQLKAAGALSGIRLITASQPSLRSISPVIGQCDTAMRSNLVRQLRGYTGKNIKIGVLSDSYDYLGGAAAGIANDELPGIGNPNGYTTPVEVVEEIFPSSGPGSDEGRAMIELIHDAAPSATFAFASAFNGEARFAENILRLKDAGCDIIVDDVFYFSEPYFQNGIVAQAVNEVRNAGVYYFSAAGNNSNYSYERSFFSGGKVNVAGLGEYEVHKFNVQQPFQPLLVPPGGYIDDWFQWDDPFFGDVQSDIDVLLVDQNGTILDASLINNIGAKLPIEELFYFNNTDQPQLVFLLMGLYAGPKPKRIKYISYGVELFVNASDYPGLGAPTVVGHSNAEGAISVAAAPFIYTPAYGVNPPIVEGFSSLGGTPLLFDDAGNRYQSPRKTRKPDFTAPDGGNTSFFFVDSSIDADAIPNFFGTSAAAPNAAAVAALVLEAWNGPRPSPTVLRDVLAKTAIDMNNPYNGNGNDKGYDDATGTGLIDALIAVEATRQLTGAARVAAREIGQGLSVDVTPNPVVGDFIDATIRGVEGQPISVSLLSPDGRTISDQSVRKSAATQQVRIPLSRQASGLFMLRVNSLTESRTVKVLK
ncbi:hypothetical protein BN8_05549 [Fibrisoma limi BUZ 3]|uniref:Peptidase S8/S53 domain-containing protein n=2 Tax=Fibrisoma limi TaxID=663275 RepID=I2GQQ0_9BACT|nr:hypothetical protein BN8_05549 [Fibrisoma limi BUZ 3]